MRALMPGDETVESGAGARVYEGIGHIPEVECFTRFSADLIGFLS